MLEAHQSCDCPFIVASAMIWLASLKWDYIQKYGRNGSETRVGDIYLGHTGALWDTGALWNATMPGRVARGAIYHDQAIMAAGWHLRAFSWCRPKWTIFPGNQSVWINGVWLSLSQNIWHEYVSTHNMFICTNISLDKIVWKKIKMYAWNIWKIHK